MNRILLYFGVVIISAGVAWLGTRLLVYVVPGWQITDSPNGERKRHARPVPLLGGAAVWGSVVLTAAMLCGLGFLPEGKVTWFVLFGMLAGSAMLMIGGFFDDRFHLPPSAQMIAPALAAVTAIISGVGFTLITNPLGGVLRIAGWVSPILAFAWLLGMMYTTKFLDGIDGLVTSLTAIGALIIFALSLRWDAPSVSTALLALALCGACLGFLPFNLTPAKIFLGEGGSVFTGYLLGLLAIVSGSKITTTLLVMGVPILDVAWVIAERAWHRTPVTRGDRRHLHFRLLERGLSTRQVVLLLSAISGAFGAVALIVSPAGKAVALAALVVVVIGLMQWARQENFHRS
ncbi:MAG: MraY family glycosyltransferase [Patescibacteria group bacterium]|nr:MraY family glycosyltransferase [Patescibacteria group bacterium]